MKPMQPVTMNSTQAAVSRHSAFSCPHIAELNVQQPRVSTIGVLAKLVVRALLDYPPTVDYHDAGAVPHGGQSMSDDYDSPPPCHFTHVSANCLLALVVEGAGRFVKN